MERPARLPGRRETDNSSTNGLERASDMCMFRWVVELPSYMFSTYPELPIVGLSAADLVVRSSLESGRYDCQC